LVMDTVRKRALFVILEKYADWEYAFIASSLNGGIWDLPPTYEVRSISLNKKPVCSIGGFNTIPDHGIDDVPDHDAIILIGGLSWRTDEAKNILPLVERAYSDGKVVGAICDATVFLGMNGMLNERKHTSNRLEDLIDASGECYNNEGRYVSEQAVRDGNLITANGTAYLEFAREVLLALKAYPEDYIENNFRFFKKGYIEMMRQ